MHEIIRIGALELASVYTANYYHSNNGEGQHGIDTSHQILHYS